MIRFEEAYALVLSRVVTIQKPERVLLLESLHRVLAEDIVSDINMPPFRKSAVDGFACRMSDLRMPLKIVETIAAGSLPTMQVEPGTCAKIMTGAPIPLGADCVLPVEDTRLADDLYVEFTGMEAKKNICELGEDIRIGDVSINKGIIIGPQHIAIMAALGYHQPLVATQPRVGILPTGDELVEPNIKPLGGQIRNSNGYQLVAQTKAAGALPSYYGIVSDSKDATYEVLAKAIAENEVVALTGGVSMGDYDYVPEIMEKLGVTIHFSSVAVQPGKPTTFGTLDNKLVFGLPGNPVSAFIQFELLVKPAIRKLMGCKQLNPTAIRLPLAEDYRRNRAERMALVPVKIIAGSAVLPVEFHGSAHIFALGNADGIIAVPIGTTKIDKGEIVDVRPL
ncbi:MAG TPA: molybdopterin molybdotransferase MoeA [Tenuifilaceae bacterium]|nr:molybdopterin molybdotransferase MoeA [Tenuifilaceae bacterium]